MDRLITTDSVLEPLIDALGTGVLVLDGEGRILHFNKAAEDLLAIGGRNLLNSFFTVPLQESVFQDVDILAYGELLNLEIFFKRCEWGNQEAWITTLRDVTSERLLENEKRRKSAFFDNTFDGAFITDLDGSILEVNKSFEEITGYSSDEVIGKTPRILKSGEQDSAYYVRMFDILEKQGYFEDKVRNRTKDGKIVEMYTMISTVYDQYSQPVHYVASITDNTSKREFLDRLKHLSNHNSLTELPNRKFFMSTLENILKRDNNSDIALIFLHVDNFDSFVEVLDTETTNQVLMDFAARIKSCFGEQCFIANTSGNIFKCIVDYSDEPALLKQIACFYGNLKTPLVINGSRLFLNASIGIVVKDIDGNDVSSLVSKARVAMDESVRNGGNTFNFFSPDLAHFGTDYLFYQSALRSALTNREFYLVYQPQVSLDGDRIVSAECLIRWPHPEKGLISPFTFIQYAERCGLIEDIGCYVLRGACRQMVTWRQQGVGIDHVSVNVSGKQLSSDRFLDDILDILEETSMNPEHLLLEVTESSLMENISTAHETLQALHDHKIRLAIDDFGTGYSSLSQLRELPFDELKIDRSFVRNLVESEYDQGFFKILMAMAEIFSLKVVVEGVEEAAQLEIARKFGATVIQGYYFFKPLKPEEFEAACQAESKQRPATITPPSP